MTCFSTLNSVHDGFFTLCCSNFNRGTMKYTVINFASEHALLDINYKTSYAAHRRSTCSKKHCEKWNNFIPLRLYQLRQIQTKLNTISNKFIPWSIV